MNKPQLNLQDAFLNQARKDNIGVTIWLNNQRQLRGNVRGFDAFTILLDAAGQPPQLVYKHAISSIVPSRPLQNLILEAMKDSGIHQQNQQPREPSPSTSETGANGSTSSAAPAVVEPAVRDAAV